MVDGFAFDGPVSQRESNTRGPIVMTFPMPTSAAPATTVAGSMTQSPEVAKCIQNCQVRIVFIHW